MCVTGRVQSVALRLVCEREKERFDFTIEHYYSVDVTVIVDANTNTVRERWHVGVQMFCHDGSDASVCVCVCVCVCACVCSSSPPL